MKKLTALLLTLFIGNAVADQMTTDKPELWVFGGQDISNSITDTKALAWGMYQETPTKYGIWDFGYLNEGHQHGASCNLTTCFNDKRDGIYALYDMQYKLNSKVRTSFGIGPYYSATTVTESNGVNYRDVYRTDLLSKAALKYSITDNIDGEVSWWHVIYSTNDLLVNGRTAHGDADVFSFGAAYKF